MNRSNRKTLLFVLIIFFLTLPSVIFAGSFKDTKGHWAEKNIEWGVKEGYILGYPDGTFKPNDPISKAEYYKITNQFIKKNTNKASDLSEAPAMAGFADVKNDDWFYNEVEMGVQAGYISNEAGENLNPTEAIMREEAIWIFAKNQDLEDNLEVAKRMLDFNEISENRRGLVGAAIEKKIVRGNEKGEIMPKKTLTRAEVVTMIAQFLHPEGVPGPDPSPNPNPNPSPQGRWYWSFNNSPPNFTKGYKINPQVLDKFSGYVTPSDANLMRNAMRRNWMGSCYGMTATAGLYKEGRLKTTGLNTPEKSGLSQLEPQANYNAQSMINAYQLSQTTRKYSTNRKQNAIAWGNDYFDKNTNDLRIYANNLKQMIDKAKSENTTVQLAYFWNKGGHANAIYDYQESPNKLVLKVYDPNYLDLDQKEVILDLNRGTMTAISSVSAGVKEQNINIRYSYAQPTSSIMKGVKETPSLEEQALVVVNGAETVTIKSGNETWSLEPNKGIKEIDSDAYQYYIPKRDSYSVSAPGGLDITIAGKNYSVGLQTDGFSKALITPRSVNVEGQKGNYFINLARDDENKNFKWNSMEISGQNGQRLGLAKEDFGFTLRGDNIKGVKITGLDKFQENNQSYNGNDKMVQIRQDGANIKLVPNKYGNYDVLPDLEDPLVGSWIGKDKYTGYNRIVYDTESTLFISKNEDGTYKVIKRVEVPALGTSYALEYNRVRYNSSTTELELRTVNCRVVSGDRNIRGSNQGPKLYNGQLNTDYGKGNTASYTRF